MISEQARKHESTSRQYPLSMHLNDPISNYGLSNTELALLKKGNGFPHLVPFHL